MGIGGRMVDERERCIGMTDLERAWRAQYLKDQILHGEPIIPDNYYKERYNPIRRFYRAPLDKLESSLTPLMGTVFAQTTRHIIAKMSFGVLIIYATWYYFKYNRSDWTRVGGWKVFKARSASYPGDKNFPYFHDKTAQEYATYGFENSPI